MKRIALPCLLALAACGGGDSACDVQDGLADSWQLNESGVTVDVARSPFGFAITNNDGTTVLSTLDGGDADGFAAVAWTTGTAGYDEFFSPGYTAFFSSLDPWHDAFEVIGAEQEGQQLTLTLRETDVAGDACATPVTVVLALRAGALRVTAEVDGDTPRAWATGFGSDADEGFLGFGERFNRTDQRGVDVFSWAEEGGTGLGEGTEAGPDNPHPSGQAMTYYPVPFFLSTKGYGFWMDTSWRSEFNLATTRTDAWRGWHVGPTLAYEIYVPPTLSDPFPAQIIGEFTETTGRPRLPPTWALGPRRRINIGDVQAGVPEIQRMRDLDLAITAVDDAMHFYPSAGHLGDEAQIAAWNQAAADLGYRVNGYYNSFINRDPASPIAEWAAEGEAAGYYVQRADGSYPDLWILTGGTTPDLFLVDFTNPDATAWYQSSFAWAEDLGYDGWMYDFAEYMPWDALGYDGRSGEELHNLYPVQYAKAFFDSGSDALAFMRSGYTGSSAYVPMAWSGDPSASFEDSDGLPSVVRAAINIGISGVPNWASDIGGFHCQRDGAQAADAELLIRWIQAGSMTVGMQDQDACVGSDSSLKASMWNSPEVMAAWAEYARLHTRLFPYLWELTTQASMYGVPPVRHLFLEHWDQPELRAIDDAYYLGPALLVAPVVERGATSRTLRLPRGTYLDWRNQTLILDGDEVTLDAPLDQLPLLLRSGYLVTMLDPTIDTLAEESSDEIVGLDDVADVYDVVGLLTDADALGIDCQATRLGLVEAPALTEAASEAELATCDGCYLLEDLGELQRLRVSSTAETITAGGVVLTNSSTRRLRWDLYLPD